MLTDTRGLWGLSSVYKWFCVDCLRDRVIVLGTPVLCLGPEQTPVDGNPPSPRWSDSSETQEKKWGSSTSPNVTRPNSLDRLLCSPQDVDPTRLVYPVSTGPRLCRPEVRTTNKEGPVGEVG